MKANQNLVEVAAPYCGEEERDPGSDCSGAAVRPEVVDRPYSRHRQAVPVGARIIWAKRKPLCESELLAQRQIDLHSPESAQRAGLMGKLSDPVPRPEAGHEIARVQHVATSRDY
jgi:hypothetical protein